MTRASPYVVVVADRRLEVSGDSAVAAASPAFAGVLDDGGGNHDATLALLAVADPAGQPPWRDLASGSHRSQDGALAIVSREPSSVETFQPGAQPRLHFAGSAEALASGNLRAQPAYHAIAAWLSGPRLQLIHGAAVAVGGRGVLLVGVGGRGKSTAALACARAGFSFLGDDLCVVEAGSADVGIPARVHGIYATAKLNPDSRERLEALDWPVLGVTPTGKDAVALPPEIRFERSVPLVAVIGVRTDGHAPGVVRPVPAPHAIGLLAPTALPMAIGSGTPANWLRTASSIAREVPAYELGVSWDFDLLVSMVHSVVELSRDVRAEVVPGRVGQC